MNNPFKLNEKTVDSVTEKPIRLTFMRLSLKDQIIFIKRLSVLIRSGTPLLSSLHMLKKQTKTKTLLTILDRLIIDIENGMYLSASMGKFRKIFGEFAVNIIEVGEISGNLPENLNYLAEELKKTQALRRKVVSAMVYPIFIICATFGITALLTVFVFPKILPIFKSINFDLPWTTRSLIFISNLFLHHGLYILLGVFVIAVLFWLSLKSEKIRYSFDRSIIAIPVLGKLVQDYNITNICRTLGVLLKSAVPIVRALQITSNTNNNLVYKSELKKISAEVLKGVQISTHLEKNPKIFPVIMSQMVAVAENTGNLNDTLVYLADMYEEEVDETTKNLSTIIEPVLLIFMGLIVGFVAISIITPIYAITQHLHP